MFQLQQVGEADARPAIADDLRRARETGELAVRHGEEHDIARRLIGVDRLVAVRNRSAWRIEMGGGSADDARRLGFDCSAVQALLADHDEAGTARLSGLPGAVEEVLDAWAYRLDDEPARLAGDGDYALDPQHVV